VNRWLRFGLDFIFLASFGFGGGCLVLLYFVVPVEQWMMDNGFPQERVDRLLSVVVAGWIVFGFAAAFLFDRYVMKQGRRLIGFLVAGATSVGACVVLYMFLNTESAIIAMNQGEVEIVSDRFTFGPYPTLEEMESLKAAGYDGIVTLLNPVLVFEGTLLQEELENGKRIGLEIHSFPMLPWVGDNKEAMDKIRRLFSEDETKRYYIHCYLGRHRVDIVKQIAMEVSGTVIELPPMLQASRLERGPVYFFEGGRVAVGPLPTDEEWFTFVFRHQTKEVISILDNETSLEQVERITDENNVLFTPMPMDRNAPDARALEALIGHVRAADHKVYIHGFDGLENRVKYVESMLRYGTPGIDLDALEEIAGMNVEAEYGSRVAVGTMPDIGQLPSLREAGVGRLVALGGTPEEWTRWEDAAARAGLEFAVGEREPQDEIGSVYRLALELLASPEPAYVFAWAGAEAAAQRFMRVMKGMHEGFERDEIAGMQTLERGTVTLLRRQRNVLLGPELTENEWETFLQANGIGKVIMLYAPSLQTRGDMEKVRALAENHQIILDVIPMFETFAKEIVDAAYRENETMYLMTLPELQPIALQGLSYRD
jgi:hypothetical protein